MDNAPLARKQLRMMRLQTILIAALLLILLAGIVFLAVRFREIGELADTLKTEVELIDVGAINDAAGNLASAAEELDMDAVGQTVEALKRAAEGIESVDMSELNDAVAALKAAAQSLSEIDVDSLNSLVEALDGTATKLGSTVNAIGGIFGR